MAAGEPYNAGDPELISMRYNAREVLDKINVSVRDIREGKRLRLCKKLFGQVGDWTRH
jgi:hypothetical protein